MRIVILVLFLMPFAYSQPPIEPGVSHEFAKWRAAHYSDVRYNLNLTLEKMSPVLKGTMEIRLKVRDAGNGGRGDAVIVLDWRKIRGHEEKSTISNVSINGAIVQSASFSSLERDKSRTLSFEESNEHLVFRDEVVAGENVIKLDFTSPILTSGSAITRYIDKEDGSEYIYSLFVPSDASTAFPVFDQPDLKARFTLTLSAPKDWTMVANSDREHVVVASSECPDDVEGGLVPLSPQTKPAPAPTRPKVCTENRAWDFRETKPISTYLFAFAAGPWQQISAPGVERLQQQSEPRAVASGSPANIQTTTGNPVATAQGSDLSTQVFVRKSQAAKFQPHAAEVFRLTREGIKFLETYFDYKFPFPKYDVVLIPEFPFGGMEHAGATFLRESAVIFPQEPTKNDYISRANVIFHEAAHQWFGDTVTMKWFDDLWLKEGFAEFMAYKTLERVMPEYNAWKAFYERIKPLAYATDSTRGTTPIYQEIKNLSAAKSAYGNIVYRKAPSFLKQAEFYLGADKFQTAVRAFLKKHQFGNAGWEDLVGDFEAVSGSPFDDMSEAWIKQAGMWKVRMYEGRMIDRRKGRITNRINQFYLHENTEHTLSRSSERSMMFNVLVVDCNGLRTTKRYGLSPPRISISNQIPLAKSPCLVFPNYQDYGYGIFLLDDKSRAYVLKNIQNEKDDFLRSMMWGALWDSVREGELDPKEYVELAIRNIGSEKDEMIVQSTLGRVSTAMTYYIGDKDRDAISPRLESMLIEKMRMSPTLGQRITYYRALLNNASTEKGRGVLKEMLGHKPGAAAVTGGNPTGREGVNPQSQVRRPQTSDTLPTGRVSASSDAIPLKTKDRFDIVIRLASLGDPEAEKLLTELEKTETSDDAKRYAYAARAAFPTKATKEKYWNDFVANKEISESWIEAAFGTFNSVRHADLTLPYLERALKELPNHKRNRKIFFVNGWLAAFIGGQRSEEALNIVNKFLADNPNLDRDLRLKILENVDLIERAVKIRAKFASS